MPLFHVYHASERFERLGLRPLHADARRTNNKATTKTTKGIKEC